MTPAPPATLRSARPDRGKAAASSYHRRLWAAAGAALALHAVAFFAGRTPIYSTAEFRMDDPAPHVDVELIQPAPIPEPPAEVTPPPEPVAPPEPAPPPEPEPMPAQIEPPPPKAEQPPKPKPPAPQKTAATRPTSPPRNTASTNTAAPAATGGGSKTTGPAHLYNPKPPYPAESRTAKEQGVVTLRVTVDPTGRPTNVSVGKSSGFSRLDRAAIEGVRRWRFKPATRDGSPFATTVDVPVRFKLQ